MKTKLFSTSSVFYSSGSSVTWWRSPTSSPSADKLEPTKMWRWWCWRNRRGFRCLFLVCSAFDANLRPSCHSPVMIFISSLMACKIRCSGQFGMPRWSMGLCLGYVASCLSSVIENIGSYDLLARVSQQRSPPKNAVNRAIMIEGRMIAPAHYLNHP